MSLFALKDFDASLDGQVDANLGALHACLARDDCPADDAARHRWLQDAAYFHNLRSNFALPASVAWRAHAASSPSSCTSIVSASRRPNR